MFGKHKMSTESYICHICGKQLGSKYTLNNHIKCVHRDQAEQKVENRKCPSVICAFSTVYAAEWRKHVGKCTLISLGQQWEKQLADVHTNYQQQLANVHTHYQQQLADVHTHYQQQLGDVQTNYSHQLSEQKVAYDLQLSTLQTEKEMLEKQVDKLEKQLERAQSATQSLAEKAINRPTNNYCFEEDDKENETDEIPLTVSEQIDSIPDSSPSDYMMTLSHLTLNNVTIISRHPDHYVNATQLCQAGAKKFNDWYRLDSTKELIAVLSSDAGIPASLLVESKRGATSLFQQGSWVHPDLAIQLAQWISPSFALQVSRWVRTLFSDGKIAIDLTLMKEQQKRIETLETVCLSKRKREKYEGQFFIYLLTTDDHLKRRTYIVGKAKNLEHRLGTYNKTCDHTVVHYRECFSEVNMTLVETMVLHRLNQYREQSNRDRFVLPQDREVTFFQQVIDQCVQFVVEK